MRRLIDVLRAIKNAAQAAPYTDAQVEKILLNQGRILTQLADLRAQTRDLKDYEFSIFSQFGEDGIIQRLISLIDLPNKTFIEFGVEAFKEANSRFLLQQNNWRGMVLDGSEKHVENIRAANITILHDLQARAAFIDRDNVQDLLASSGFDRDLGILSIDVDGVDYWLYEAIENYQPRILIVEYNAVFGSERAISVPYKSDFVRRSAHYSNAYFGASLSAFHHLASKRGYALVGTNGAGGNAFFVRRDLLGATLGELSVAEAFTPTLFSDTRNPEGALTFLRGDRRLKEIMGLPVVNVITGQAEII